MYTAENKRTKQIETMEDNEVLAFVNAIKQTSSSDITEEKINNRVSKGLPIYLQSWVIKKNE